MKQENKSPVREATDHRTTTRVGPHLVGGCCPGVSESFGLAVPSPCNAEQTCLTFLLGWPMVQKLGDVSNRKAGAPLLLLLFRRQGLASLDRLWRAKDGMLPACQ